MEAANTPNGERDTEKDYFVASLLKDPSYRQPEIKLLPGFFFIFYFLRTHGSSSGRYSIKETNMNKVTVAIYLRLA